MKLLPCSTVCMLLPLLGLMSVPIATAAQYIGQDVYQLGWPAGGSNFTVGNEHEGVPGFGTQVVGQAYPPSDAFQKKAVMWNQPTGAATYIHPLSNFLTSQASATDGISQVGYGYINGPPEPQFYNHAILWHGTAASAVDLHPTSLPQFSVSYANGVKGNEQVGEAIGDGGDHAMLWHGTPESAIDLHPTHIANVLGSVAAATDGVHQVGVLRVGNGSHAVLWSGSADSAVDLHGAALAAFFSSIAYGVGGNQQVGIGTGFFGGGTGNERALLWKGTANSVVNLHPTNLGFCFDSQSYSTNGSLQVGSGTFDEPGFAAVEALLWSGAANSAVNLHKLLPLNQFVESTANSIDAQGVIHGTARDYSGNLHLVRWSPVPEPATLLIAGVALAVAMSQRQLIFGRARVRSK